MPYPLRSTADGEEFTTEAGVRYLVYFSDASGYFPGFRVAPYAFMLGFRPLDPAGPAAEHDPRVGETIRYVAEQFFEDERRVLAYVCQQGPQERARHRLFATWFNRYHGGRFIRRVVGEQHGLSAAFIYSKANPFAQELSQLPSMEDKLSQY